LVYDRGWHIALTFIVVALAVRLSFSGRALVVRPVAFVTAAIGAMVRVLAFMAALVAFVLTFVIPFAVMIFAVALVIAFVTTMVVMLAFVIAFLALMLVRTFVIAIVVVPIATMVAGLARVMMLVAFVPALRTFVHAVTHSALAQVQLNVPPTRPISTQVASGRVFVGKYDLERIVSTRLTVVAHRHHRCSRGPIDRHVITDLARHIVDYLVVGHHHGLHMHPRAMIDIVEMAPESAFANSARHSKIGFLARGPNNPAAASHKIVALRGGGRRCDRVACNVGVNQTDESIEATGINDMDRDQPNGARFRGTRTDLFVQDEARIAEVNHLIGVPGDINRRPINREALDL